MSFFLTRAAQLALVAGVLSAASFAPAGAVKPEHTHRHVHPVHSEMAFSAAQEVSDAELSESRGAFLPSTFNLNINNVTQSAQDSQNLVIGGITGSNAINGSFNNSSGLVNVIQNSGNNVIIQSSTVVNMTFNK